MIGCTLCPLGPFSLARSHITAGVKKKLVKLGKYKDCSLINEWTNSITNHMYWCAASTPDGNGEEIATRWKSLMDHICDSHEGCYHLPLGQMERRRKWFIPGKECALYKCICITVSFVVYNNHIIIHVICTN